MIRIREATPRDAALLARLGASLFEQTFGAQNRPEDMRAYLTHAFDATVQERELGDPEMRTWIAEDERGDAVGYVQLRLSARSPVDGLVKPAELVRIYTDARWHGRGVGLALLDTCVHAARDAGAGDLWLGVWKLNPRGIAFYQKHGFRIAAEQLFQLGSDTQYDWVMVRSLRDAAAPGALSGDRS